MSGVLGVHLVRQDCLAIERLIDRARFLRFITLLLENHEIARR